MTVLFITILNMSITAGIVALAVMLVRIPLKKSPKIFSYALWGVVLFRLVCPLSIESSFSFMPTPTAVIPQDIVYSQNPALQTGIQFFDAPINTAINNAFPTTNQANIRSDDTDVNQEDYSSLSHENYTPAGVPNNAPVNNDISPIHTFTNIAAYVWLSGFATFLLYAGVGYVRLKRRVYFATLVRDNIYETDKINTPFALGFIRPKIYIPIGIDPAGHGYILEHEQTHIRRRDYLIKPVAFIAFAMHWFNPVMWAAYFLMSKDIEMSCDEAVLRKTDEDIRSEYGATLLNLSVKRGSLLLSPLAFGESGVKGRIKNVLNFKKQSQVIIVAALALVIVLSVGFAVDRIAIEPIINDMLMENVEPDLHPQANDAQLNQQESVQQERDEQASETQYGNTSGNISNGAFAAQSGEYIYYVQQTGPEDFVRQGELIRTNADGSDRAVLLSDGRPHSLNIVDGWIYYISGNANVPNGLIFKMREDGTENTLITSAGSGQDYSQGYTTQEVGMVLRMAVVGDWIYCRVYEALDDGRYNSIYRINTGSGEAERLRKVGASMHGLAVYDGWIYYSTGDPEADELGVFRMRTDGSDNTRIAESVIPTPSIANGKIYYIGGDEVSGAQIYGMDLDGANNGRVGDGIAAVTINVTGDWIYFADHTAIYKVKTDGTGMMKLCDYPGASWNIDLNVFGDWVYLTGHGLGLYKVRTDGSELQEVEMSPRTPTERSADAADMSAILNTPFAQYIAQGYVLDAAMRTIALIHPDLGWSEEEADVFTARVDDNGGIVVTGADDNVFRAIEGMTTDEMHEMIDFIMKSAGEE